MFIIIKSNTSGFPGPQRLLYTSLHKIVNVKDSSLKICKPCPGCERSDARVKLPSEPALERKRRKSSFTRLSHCALMGCEAGYWGHRPVSPVRPATSTVKSSALTRTLVRAAARGRAEWRFLNPTDLLASVARGGGAEFKLPDRA